MRLFMSDHIETSQSADRRRRALLLQAIATGACAIALPCRVATAQTPIEKFPTKPVQLIVPYPPGGSNDGTARLVAKQLAQVWRQPVVIDNKPGAGGIIGATALARSVPDGHTLALVSQSFTTSAAAQAKLPYDPVKDFVPVALAGSGPFVILVSPNLGVKSLRDLVAMARKEPGRLTFGSSGVGSSNQFATELFMDVTGVQMVHVPHRGISPAIVDLAGGHLDVVFTTLASAQAMLANRSVRLLAVTSQKRMRQLPEVPTAEEAGIAGYQFDGWSGFLAPKGTPPALVTFLNASINRAMASPEVANALAAEGMTPFEPVGPEAFRKIVMDDLERWKRIARERGIRAE